MKRIIALLLALIIVFSLLCACKKEEPTIPQNTQTDNIPTDESGGGAQVVDPQDPDLPPLVLSSNNSTGYEIVSLFDNSEISLHYLLSRLTDVTGVPFSSGGSLSVGSMQIVIGSYDDLKNVDGAPSFKSWTGSSISVKGYTVFIALYDTSVWNDTVNCFIEQIKPLENGGYGIAADLRAAYDKCAISGYVPFFASAQGEFKGVHSSGGGNYQLSYTGISDAELDDYRVSLRSSGYSLHQSNKINGNSFYLYEDGDTVIHINHFKRIDQFAIIYGPKTYLPAKKAVTNYEKVVEPTITQVALIEGLSIVQQLEDGSFVIIDGGSNHEESKIHLWQYLSAKVPSGEKPRITWMITHIHSDHINLFKSFISQYGSYIDLELVAWNLPDFKEITASLSPNWSDGGPAERYASVVTTMTAQIKELFPETPIYTFHTGEKLYLPGCEIEFLVCPEDYFVYGFKVGNDTSCAWRVTMGSRTMMVFGDCTIELNDTLTTPLYGNYIKSDILQLAHHGVGGQTLATSKAVDPDICLWASDQKTFDHDPRALGIIDERRYCHAWLRENFGNDGQRMRQHHNNSQITIIYVSTMQIYSQTIFFEE